MSMTDFWQCSLWEFICNVEGFRKANSSENEVEPMSFERYDEFIREHGYDA